MLLLDSYLKARGRGVLPSALGSAEQRAVFTAAVRARAVFSARTTNVVYLEILRGTLEDLLRTETADGRAFGQAEARLRLKQALAALHYDPENGHFGTPEDAAIPPAERGSLQDLSSDRRIDLILDVQRMRWQAAGQAERGMQPAVLAAYPAWELIPGPAMEPRQNWPQRWQEAGGTLYGEAEDRLIAHKESTVWHRLGSLPDYRDGIDGGLPPFAFGSKRVWRAVSASECKALGVDLTEGRKAPASPAQPSGKAPAKPATPPAPDKSTAAARLPAPAADLPVQISDAGKAALEKTTLAKPVGRRLTYQERLAASIADTKAAWGQ